MLDSAALAWTLILIAIPLIVFLGFLATRKVSQMALERRIDACLVSEASKVVECGFRGPNLHARCIKLKGHVENGDTHHMFYSDGEDF
jgi:hypothetical protein